MRTGTLDRRFRRLIVFVNKAAYLSCCPVRRPEVCRPVLGAVSGAPSGPAGASMGDRTMPPPRGPVNPRKKFAVKPGFSMLVGQRADLFLFCFLLSQEVCLKLLEVECATRRCLELLTDGYTKHSIIIPERTLTCPK